MAKLPKDKIEKVLELLGNSIFGVTFTKKDGSTRVMSCRKRVAKFVKHKIELDEYPRDKVPSQVIRVYQMVGTSGSQNYRSINIDSISRITAYGITAEIADTSTN